jgi:DNA-binding TFAR19-related protein (PDSD5 family)
MENNDVQERIQLQKQVEMLENVAKQNMTKEAIMRYGNVKTAYPEKAVKVAVIIAQMVQNGQINEKIDDFQLKNLLTQMQNDKI